jgi:hypothetical protein
MRLHATNAARDVANARFSALVGALGMPTSIVVDIAGNVACSQSEAEVEGERDDSSVSSVPDLIDDSDFVYQTRGMKHMHLLVVSDFSDNDVPDIYNDVPDLYFDMPDLCDDSEALTGFSDDGDVSILSRL